MKELLNFFRSLLKRKEGEGSLRETLEELIEEEEIAERPLPLMNGKCSQTSLTCEILPPKI